MARRLGLPVRTWYNYEAGVTVPAEVVLRIVELTAAEPTWLLHGKGQRFRSSPMAWADEQNPHSSVTGLLRAALEKLENGEDESRPSRIRLREIRPSGETTGGLDPSEESLEHILISVEEGAQLSTEPNGEPHYIAARREWLEAEYECRCLRVSDDAMHPLVANGAYVAYSNIEEPVETLDNALSVVWIDGKPIVRWIQIQGRYVILRAQNLETKPITILLELDRVSADHQRLRRVLWISTPR